MKETYCVDVDDFNVYRFKPGSAAISKAKDLIHLAVFTNAAQLDDQLTIDEINEVNSQNDLHVMEREISAASVFEALKDKKRHKAFKDTLFT